MKCPFCKKDNSVRHGTRKNKSGWVKINLCKSCNRHFSNRQGFEKMKTKPEIIVVALDLRAKGLTLGEIRQHLAEHYKYEVNRSTILRWQTKFGKMIENFTKQFTLPHSKNLHADEIFLRLKGSGKDEFIYYWDCIDYETKFIVGDLLSIARTDEFAIQFMQKIKSRLEKPPDNIHTDNSWDYPPAIKKVFRNKTKHIHFPAWKRKFKNNPIERYHKTVKRIYKILCKYVNTETALNHLIFLRNYYNFLRPHLTLNNQTPSQVAGFGKWNWWTIIKTNKNITPCY
jgi:putative transposase